MTPLGWINEQCRLELDKPKPRMISALRMHPRDRDEIDRELDERGFAAAFGTGHYPTHAGKVTSFFELWRLVGVPIHIDESCLDGPVVEWRGPYLEQSMTETIELLKRWQR